MRTILTARAASPHPPDHVYELIRDASRWPDWSPDTEYVQRNGPLAPGTTGVMKLKGGPKLRYTIQTVSQDHEYTDVTRLPGARVRFQHLVEPRAEGGSQLSAHVSIEGPFSLVWNKLLGGGFKKSVPGDLERLATL
jgi:hypothetical protein